MLDVKIRYHGACKLHKRYKPEIGVLPTKNCDYCDALYAIALYAHVIENRIAFLEGSGHGSQAETTSTN